MPDKRPKWLQEVARELKQSNNSASPPEQTEEIVFQSNLPETTMSKIDDMFGDGKKNKGSHPFDNLGTSQAPKSNNSSSTSGLFSGKFSSKPSNGSTVAPNKKDDDLDFLDTMKEDMEREKLEEERRERERLQAIQDEKDRQKRSAKAALEAKARDLLATVKPGHPDYQHTMDMLAILDPDDQFNAAILYCRDVLGNG